jgi:hypothetical protein
MWKNARPMPTLQLVSTIGIGLLAGVHHALSGPDHLAGVAPLATDKGRGAWRIGVGWGLGHASGAMLAAVVVLALRESVPQFESTLAPLSETIVGILLCVLGVIGLSRAIRSHHEHAHATSSRGKRTAFALGLFHGAAGLSHVFAVLPALALPGALLPAAYLCGYGVGSLIAIVAFASALGRLAGREHARSRRVWLGVASAASLAVGILWIVHPL